MEMLTGNSYFNGLSFTKKDKKLMPFIFTTSKDLDKKSEYLDILTASIEELSNNIVSSIISSVKEDLSKSNVEVAE